MNVDGKDLEIKCGGKIAVPDSCTLFLSCLHALEESFWDCVLCCQVQCNLLFQSNHSTTPWPTAKALGTVQFWGLIQGDRIVGGKKKLLTNQIAEGHIYISLQRSQPSNYNHICVF